MNFITEDTLRKMKLSEKEIKNFDCVKRKANTINFLKEYGIEVTEDGYVKGYAITQESGMQLGSPLPRECYIHSVNFGPNAKKMLMCYCEKINRKTDLPFYCVELQVKLIGQEVKVTPEILKENGFEPYKD